MTADSFSQLFYNWIYVCRTRSSTCLNEQLLTTHYAPTFVFFEEHLAFNNLTVNVISKNSLLLSCFRFLLYVVCNDKNRKQWHKGRSR